MHNYMDYGQQLYLKDTFTPNGYVDRKVTVEEIVRSSHSNTTLIRKISCHKSCGNYQEENLQVQILQNFDDNTTLRSKFQNKMSTYAAGDFHSHEATGFVEEPMEVDLSNDRALVEDMERLTPNLRSLNFRRKLTKVSEKQDYATSETSSSIIPVYEPLTSKFYLFLITLSILFTMIGIYIVIAGDRFVYVNRNVQLQNIKEELQKNVLYQEDALNTIIRTFEQMDSWRDPMKILPFIGSTGIGKTFTANIIREHFYPLAHEIHSKDLASTEEQQSVIHNLNSCCCNLIVIDDLRATDMYHFLEFVKILPKSHHLLIIPIFNIQDTIDGLNYKINKEDFKFIRDEFANAEVFHELVVFDILQHHMVEEWLRSELHKRDVDTNRHSSLIKFLLDNNHVKYKGFKGLSAKLQLAVGDAQ